MNFWFSHFCSPHDQRTSCHVADLIFFSTQVLSTDHTTSVECGQRSLSNTEMSTFGSLYTTFVRACMYVIPLKLGLDLIKATYHYFSYFVVFFYMLFAYSHFPRFIQMPLWLLALSSISLRLELLLWVLTWQIIVTLCLMIIIYQITSSQYVIPISWPDRPFTRGPEVCETSVPLHQLQSKTFLIQMEEANKETHGDMMLM